MDSETTSKTPQKNDSIEKKIQGLQIEDNPLIYEEINNLASNKSFIDDQFMLEAVETFEKVKVKTPKHVNMNTTVVSQAILNLCDVLEKNVRSGKKDAAASNKTPSRNSDSDLKKVLNYSFGEQTMRDILNSPTSPKPIKPDNEENLKKIMSTQPEIDQFSNEKNDILKFFLNLNLTTLNINIINNLCELNTLFSLVKPKLIVSISLACNKINKETAENVENKSDLYMDFYDDQRECFVRFFGIFVCFESEKSKQVNLVLIKNERNYLEKLKELFEKDDLTKIMFFAKKHVKILYKYLGFVMKSPCYDPIVANWLLNQDQLNILQIKQKYAASLNIPIDTFFKTSKSCYGCLNNVEIDRFSAIKGALIECLIGINCFEKLRLQLQLENIWIYFAKIESEIVLLSARIELIGMGLNLDELENLKAFLLKKKKEIEEKTTFYSGKEINLNSTDEISYMLYSKLKLVNFNNHFKNLVYNTP